MSLFPKQNTTIMVDRWDDDPHDYGRTILRPTVRGRGLHGAPQRVVAT